GLSQRVRLPLQPPHLPQPRARLPPRPRPRRRPRTSPLPRPHSQPTAQDAPTMRPSRLGSPADPRPPAGQPPMESRLTWAGPVKWIAPYHDMPAAFRKGLHRDAGAVLAETGAPVERVASHVALGAERGD